ncbi:hypothetical protein LUZ60_002894 [Juncus effusus]|nr:hypothetical protein LUZ60_002894 [Juncus effusus]
MSTKESLNMETTCQMESFSTVYRGKLVGYSLTQHFDANTHFTLGTFDLAGHSWAINFYPNHTSYDSKDQYTSFFGTLLTETSTPLSVECKFCLLDQSGRSSAIHKGTQMVKEKGNNFGFFNFMKRSQFEWSEYLKDDYFILQCVLRVIKPSYKDVSKKLVVVPSPDLPQHFAKLLESQEGADITFELNEETIVAHKYVLAARSPVFKAQFFGAMMKTESNHVKIEDVKPEVFRLMLHFIYTDMLPAQEAEISSEMAQHLLVVADRYGLERLKLISAEILCENLSVENSATTLVLAEQHNCQQLKEVCIDFVSSREVLDDVMASEGFGHLIESCPLLLKELLKKVDNSRKF